MKNMYWKKKVLASLAILFFISNATSQKIGDEVERVISDLQDGNWRKKGESAKKIATMTEIPIEKKLQLLFDALEKECRYKTSDKKPDGSYKTISVYLKDQYVFAIADAGIEDPKFILRRLNKAEGEFKDRLILSLGLLKFKDDNVTSRVIQLAKNSQDGYIRALATITIKEWEDTSLIPVLKDGLKDSFKINVKTDRITPNTYKSEDGYYYYEYYPVRNKAASGLKKLGVKVKRNESEFWVESP